MMMFHKINRTENKKIKKITQCALLEDTGTVEMGFWSGQKSGEKKLSHR